MSDKQKKAFIKKQDLIMILILLGIAFFFMLTHRTPADFAEVYFDAKLIKVLDLNEDTTFTPEERPQVVIEVKSHEAAFIHSDCPDKICVHTGFIAYDGQSASCLPNKVVITVKKANDDYDAII